MARSRLCRTGARCGNTRSRYQQEHRSRARHRISGMDLQRSHPRSHVALHRGRPASAYTFPMAVIIRTRCTFTASTPARWTAFPAQDPAELVEPGDSFTYEFDAEPFGLHLYHCHVFPLARHIAKGLYGTFIVDPKEGRPPVDREMVMVMSGIDVDFDDVNDFYAVNGIPFHYQNNPIQSRSARTVRIYLVNILEFDLLNSFHLHANFFHYYPTGTSLTPSEYTDTMIQGQAQRGILEFSATNIPACICSTRM